MPCVHVKVHCVLWQISIPVTCRLADWHTCTDGRGDGGRSHGSRAQHQCGLAEEMHRSGDAAYEVSSASGKYPPPTCWEGKRGVLWVAQGLQNHPLHSSYAYDLFIFCKFCTAYVCINSSSQNKYQSPRLKPLSLTINITLRPK